MLYPVYVLAHGIDKKRTLPARLSIREGNIQISTQFIVNCADHGIKIPTLMFNLYDLQKDTNENTMKKDKMETECECEWNA